MIIPVTAALRLNMEDAKNYTVEKRRIVQEGKNAGQEQWDTLGYYPNLRKAAESILGSHFSYLSKDLEAAKDLKSLIAAIDEGSFLIAKACEERKESST